MKANIKLMNDLIDEVKSWLIQDDNSLAVNLTKIRSRIADIDKLTFTETEGFVDLEGMEQMARLQHDLYEFMSYFDQMVGSVSQLFKAVTSVSGDKMPLPPRQQAEKEIQKMNDKMQKLIIKDEIKTKEL